MYYGSPNVTDIFNKDAFINCADYDSFDDVIEKIKELDRDDEKYLAMLRQPILVDPGYTQRVFDDMERFVCSIFDQPIEKAFRRSRVYMPQEYDEVLSKVMHRYNYSPIKRCKKLVKRILKLWLQIENLYAETVRRFYIGSKRGYTSKNGKTRKKYPKATVWERSVTLYLMHGVVFCSVVDRLVWMEVPKIYIAFVSIVGTILATWFVGTYLEKPIQSVLRKRFLR